MDKIVLEAVDVSKSYIIDQKDISVIKNVNLLIRRGEFVVIKGPSGSGKTTLLSVLSGIDHPSCGKIMIEGQDITHLKESELAAIRNLKIGFVFQNYHLVPSLTGAENVMFPAELNKDPEVVEKAEYLIERVGLSHRKNNFPEQLSGGEKQRFAICRALINNPTILFGDEPTGNLDSENSREIIKLLLEMCRDQKTTMIVASHSDLLAESADRLIYLQDGEVTLTLVGKK